MSNEPKVNGNIQSSIYYSNTCRDSDQMVQTLLIQEKMYQALPKFSFWIVRITDLSPTT